jgi:hypothetical protein
MTKRSIAGLAAVAWLFGSVACAGGMSREDDEAAAAPQDTTEAQNPPGYRGMERDTTQVPTDSQPTPVDTFLQEQGTGVPEDTAGYGGLEQPDTTGAAQPDTGMSDTTGFAQPDTGMSDTTGFAQPDTGMVDTTGATGVDTAGMIDTAGQSTWDTTGQQ